MKDKLEIGMYIRTKNGIGKVDETEMFMDKYFQFHLDSNKGSIHNVTTNTYWNHKEDIIGIPSFDILSLIDEGDLVTIKSKYCDGEIYQVVEKCANVIGLDCYQDGIMYVDNNDIKTVVTKEQFAAMEYEVK